MLILKSLYYKTCPIKINFVLALFFPSLRSATVFRSFLFSEAVEQDYQRFPHRDHNRVVAIDKSGVQISGRTLATISESFHDLPQFLQRNIWFYVQLATCPSCKRLFFHSRAAPRPDSSVGFYILRAKRVLILSILVRISGYVMLHFRVDVHFFCCFSKCAFLQLIDVYLFLQSRCVTTENHSNWVVRGPGVA